MSDAPEPLIDCTACGACCARDPMINVTATQEEKEIIADDSLFIPASSGVWLMRSVKEPGKCAQCAALSGSPFVAVSCSIYNVRPNSCHSFERGSAECVNAISYMKRVYNLG